MTDLFDGLYGHERIKKQLGDALILGRISHAYIFCGPKGVGKYTAARMFAGAAIGCGASEHPDIITVTNELYGVESKSNAILADTVTEMRRDIYIMPYSGDRKFYIVPNADTMNIVSQNKLLKVFEEPPEYCTIIFTAENRDRFLPTIISRASIIRFEPLSIDTVADYLTKVKGLSHDEAAADAVISGGSIGRALSVLNDAEPRELRDKLIAALTALAGSGNRPIYDLAAILKGEKDNINFVFDILKSFFRDLLHIKLGLADDTVNKDKKEELGYLARTVTEKGAAALLDTVMKYEKIRKTNASFRIEMFCLAHECREEIHGRNYRSTI